MIDSYIGHIALFSYDRVPQGWLPCNGQALETKKYSGLYGLIGNRFPQENTPAGTFRIPDFNSAEPNSDMKYYICVDGLFPYKP